MDIHNFKEEDWRYESQSGFGSFRNTKTNEWVYIEEFNDVKNRKRSYELDYELLAEFRSECLPFGEYPEIVLQNFLNKKHKKKD